MKRNVTVWTGFFRIVVGPSGGHSFVLVTVGISEILLRRISSSKREKSADTLKLPED
jgi:hypothetical protein